MNLLAFPVFFQLLSADTSEPPDETCSQISFGFKRYWESLGNGRLEGVKHLAVEKRELS